MGWVLCWMKVQLLSDLHLEYLEDVLAEGEATAGTIDFTMIVEPAAPVLLMAGDIATLECPLLPHFLQWVSARFENVYWVLGNHEFYNTKRVGMAVVKQRLAELCPQNVRILDNETVVLDDVAIIGSTLWSHVPAECSRKVQTTVSDYRYVFGENERVVTVDDTNRLHEESVAFLKNELEKYKGKYTVVVTHHAPSMKGTIHPTYCGSPLNHAFATDLELVRWPDVWCYGHTHYNATIDDMGCKIMSNQFGYEGEHDGRLYKFAFVIYVGSDPHYG